MHFEEYVLGSFTINLQSPSMDEYYKTRCVCLQPHFLYALFLELQYLTFHYSF